MMDPTPEQVDPLVEAVARAIDNEMPGYGYGERAARAAIAAIRQAEPLTSTPEPSRRYLAWLCHGCDECAKPDSERTTPCHGPSMSGAWVTLAERPPWMSEEEYAEPLHQGPEPSTTETGPEGADMHSSVPTTDVENLPPGFEWEYRLRHPDADDLPWFGGEQPVPWAEDWWLERRLVGKPERMED